MAGFYPGLYIRGECKQEPGGGRTLTHSLTYLLTYLLECCCAYLVLPKFDLCIFPIKVGKTVC